MLTVTLDCEESGKSNTRKPLSKSYSVIPSTDATFLGGAAKRDSWSAKEIRQPMRNRVEAMGRACASDGTISSRMRAIARLNRFNYAMLLRRGASLRLRLGPVFLAFFDDFG